MVAVTRPTRTTSSRARSSTAPCRLTQQIPRAKTGAATRWDRRQSDTMIDRAVVPTRRRGILHMGREGAVRRICGEVVGQGCTTVLRSTDATQLFRWSRVLLSVTWEHREANRGCARTNSTAASTVLGNRSATSNANSSTKYSTSEMMWARAVAETRRSPRTVGGSMFGQSAARGRIPSRCCSGRPPPARPQTPSARRARRCFTPPHTTHRSTPCTACPPPCVSL